MVFKLSACTWNMQKGDIANTKKGDALLFLRKNYDVLFIQESGKSLRADPNFLSKEWTIDERGDNQNDAYACRSMLFVMKGKLTGVPLKLKSGGDNAFRWPASAIWTVDGLNILLVSFHATSSGRASDNSADLFQVIDDWLDSKHCQAAIVGADFNTALPKFQPVFSINGPTQQSGDTLDGFMVFGAATCLDVRDVPVFDLQIDAGCYFLKERVSDHLPLEARIEVEEAMDTEWDED